MKSTGMTKANKNDNKRYRSLSYLCLALLLLVASATVFVASAGAANEGSNFPVSVETGGAEPPVLLNDDQQNPSIVALPDKNKWFVVWEDWRNASTSGADLYGRFINADGSLCGDEIVISTASGNQTAPVLAYRNSSQGDNILIAWQDSRGTTSSGYVYYRVCTISALAENCSTGVVLGSTNSVGYRSIDSDRLISRKLPKIAYDKSRDEFWMVWVESRNQLQRLKEYPFGYYGSPEWQFADSNYIAYTTVSAGSGSAVTPEILRNTTASQSRTVRLISSARTDFSEDGGTVTYIYEYFTDINNITVACDDSSPEALIAWEGVRGKATLTCKWEEKDDETFTVVECQECDDTADPGCEDVCEDVEYPNPDYGVPTINDSYTSELKTEFESGGSADGMVHIYTIFDKYISQPVVHTRLIDASDSASYYPALGYDSIHRKFLLAWEDRGSTVGDGIHSNIFGQLLYSGGGLYGSNFPISFQDADGDGSLDDDVRITNQTRPNVAVDTSNQRFFISWQDGRNSNLSLENLDIYGQFVDSEGSLRGGNYAVCNARANQYNPVTAYNQANHNFLTVWKDARNLNTSNSDIYAQRFSLGQPQLVLLDAEGGRLTPALIDFSSVKLGQSSTIDIILKNSGDSPVVIDALTPLQKPFYYVDLPAELVSVEDGLSIDLLPGVSFVLGIKFATDTTGVFNDSFMTISDSTDLGVNLQAQGAQKEIYAAPGVLDFANVEIGDIKTLDVVITNNSEEDIQVKGALTGLDVFSVSGIDAGAVIKSGGGMLTGQVQFIPDTAGYVENGLYMNLGPVQDMANIPFEEIDWGTQYTVLLKGSVNAYFVNSEYDTNTADINYKVSMSASTAETGQLYVLFSHDPLSSGNIYALTKDGSLELFPYKSANDWQGLWYLEGASPGMELDLSQVDFRGLGCDQCQGETVDGSVVDFHFGDIVITPPDEKTFNNASDFKYMPGTLYMGTYVKNAGSSGAFDFNKGLLEMQSLHINSLAGTWQVTSRYDGVDRVHPTHLVVSESGDGNISAFWPGYNVTLVYADDASGYVMTFTMDGVYHYTYNITTLAADKFSGTYTCIANGEVLEAAPISGVRIQ